jgi:predicted secreted hydrolase
VRQRGPRAAWLLALAAAGGVALAGAPPTELAGVVATQPASGFAQVLAPRAFSFPADHGPHAEYRQEWWYTTGNLDAADGERFGFELTFFRYALAPAAQALRPASASAWRTDTIYMAHFAVTDLTRQSFVFAQQLSRAALGLAGAQGSPLRVWVDDWYLRSAPDAPSSWQLRAAQHGYELELDLDASAAPVLNGAQGLSVKSQVPGDASYYYSMPRVRARGQLKRDGRTLSVHGLAWFDREWGSGGLGAQQVGWDWFALQLEDGSALMFYALRARDGGRDPHSAGTWVEPSGTTRALQSDQVAIEVGAHWSSPRGVAYPAAWRLRVPELALDVAVQPVLADQELDSTPRYWEGAVDVHGTRAGQTLNGRGYVELVGYAQER